MSVGTGNNGPWRYSVPLVTVLAGLLFGASAATAHGTDLRGRRTELTAIIDAEQQRNQRYQQRYERLQRRVDALSKQASRRHVRVRGARRQARHRAGPAGFTAVTGAAVRVTLDDAPRPRGGNRPEGRRPTPDDLVVHQQDVQAVMNALWAGGARAMRVMNQRVIATSSVQCVGNTLILQGVVYSPPYTITAVGDPAKLEQALASSRRIDLYQRYAAAYGLTYEVESLRQVTLRPYGSAYDLRYVKVP